MRDEFWDVPSNIIKSHPYNTLELFYNQVKQLTYCLDLRKTVSNRIQPLTITVSGIQPKISAEFSVPSSLLEAHHPEHNHPIQLF